MSARKRSFILISAFSMFAALLFSGCASTHKPGLLLPVGRLPDRQNELAVRINTEPYKARTVKDGAGGDWYFIPFTELHPQDRVTLIIRKTPSAVRLHEENIDHQRWTAPCFLIDSGDPGLMRAALELTEGCRSTDEKAKRILEYVVNHVAFRIYPGMHYAQASSTLKLGYGICVNHARLFVALCRAAGIPSRTVSGAIADGKNVYFHHEWVEFYDDAKAWHVLEPTFSLDFEFADLRRVDLVYDIEANTIYPFARGWEKTKVALGNGDVSVFCSNWTLQRQTGEMSYTMLADRSPYWVELFVEYPMAPLYPGR